MKLPPYPAYKPSGVEWLGDVPEHWEVKRLKFQLSKMEQGWSPQCDNTPADEGEWGVLKAGAVNGHEFDSQENKRLPPEETPLPEFEIRSGDFLISRANTRELLGSAALVREVQPQLLLCDKLYRLTIKQALLAPEFLLRFMRCQAGRFEFERDASGSSASMQNIGQQSVRNLWIPLPPLIEQTNITAFLDRETGRVDRLVAKKRELIERLKEKRTALISRTVTRGLPAEAAAKAGLPANPPLKPSGLDWLGDIPTHWAVRKFSREVAIAEGQVDPEKEPYASMLLIGPEHVESGTGRLLQRATAADQAAESGKYLSSKGDVIYSKIRPALRKLVIAPEDCLCSADMYPLRGRSRVDNRFLAWFLLSAILSISSRWDSSSSSKT